jgi:hypothetical protein
MVSYAEPVVVIHVALSSIWFVNHGELNEPEVVYDGMLYRASDCEAWCVILTQWLSTMVSYAELVVVNHVVSW